MSNMRYKEMGFLKSDYVMRVDTYSDLKLSHMTCFDIGFKQA